MLEIREDRWLSNIFGHGVFRIDVDSTPPLSTEDLSVVPGAVLRHAHRRPAAMYYAKVDAVRVDLTRALSAAGLYIVDVNVTLGMDSKRAPGLEARTDVSVGEAEPRHETRLLEIAATCFRYSRFHLDPLIPTRVANRIKRDWIENYFRKARGDKLFAAFVADQPVGFLAAIALEARDGRVVAIDLIGVAETHQRRGVGEALVASFINYYRDRYEWLQVGTQVANAPSIRLYERCGFSVSHAQYVMHMHIPPSGC